MHRMSVDQRGSRVSRWKAVDAPRRVSLVLGVSISAFGVIQLGALMVWSVVASVWVNAKVGEGSPASRGLSDQGSLALLLRFPLSTLTLWIMPIVTGLGGVLVYRLRRRLAGQVIVVLATGCMVVAAITKVYFGGANDASIHELVNPFTSDTITALPVCLALVVATLASSPSSLKATRPPAPGQIPTSAS